MKSYFMYNLLKIIFYFILIYPNGVDFASSADETIKYNEILLWADKLGVELWHLGDFITRRKEVEESFKTAQVIPRVGQKIVDEMAKEIQYMMDLKTSAIRRIMETAEITSMELKEDAVNIGFPYYNAKEMLEPGEIAPTQPPLELSENIPVTPTVPPKEIVLTPHRHFFNIPVNITHSAVHVPTNVFDRSKHVIKAIQWSEELDNTFQNNYKNDPTLSWQFFGSSTGFMRQYPASKWRQDTVDLFDCRLRSWYINSATSPKDIIILIDNSGSMTGHPRDIARHVVSNILDTLGTEDYVNIFTFSDLVTDVVPCFRDNLVQANMENVRELKLGLEEFNTSEIANVTAALTKAFEILERYRSERLGARCNQAIMLICDGIPFSYQEIFEQYNWLNSSYIPVRIFTYLIGKEVADVADIKAMACNNRGYYVHLSTFGEVREHVQNYIAVMARPLVLWGKDHPVFWTGVYADVTDPKMTDWLWEVKECKEQKERFFSYHKNRSLFISPEEQERRAKLKTKLNQDQSTSSSKYTFMTTVSIPVFDLHENATRIANLLGVAGTDVPIDEIKKLMMPFKLGVNGYAFIVTNNGYILTHPDLRPLFQDILKPAYNSVDMVEVELMDDSSDAREFNPLLIEIRDSIVNQTTGSKWMLMKSHLDNMKRVSRMKRQYFWTGIAETPFTLVVTYPEGYGVNRIQIRSEDEIHRVLIKGSNVIKFFSGHHWKIHPEWLYCKHGHKTFHTPEAELKYFVDRMQAPGWKWPLNRTRPPPEHIYSNTSTGRSSSFSDKDSYYCDRNLMQSVVFDARQTEWFTRNLSSSNKDDKGNKTKYCQIAPFSDSPSPIAVLMGLLPRNEFKQRFGITVAFLATHSGLTRWQEFHSTVVDELLPEQEFGEKNKRSIDEIWYKRAVEQYAFEPQSFIYSVPFEVGHPNDTLVTASHAVFITEKDKSAPAAVVGFQFHHSALHALFRNITSNCVETPCLKTCASDDVECYILDNNGYVIIGSLNETGKFFGEVRGSLMERLVSENVYKEVTIFDYQAICFVDKATNSPANILHTPILHIMKMFRLLSRYLVWILVQTTLLPVEAYGSYSGGNGEYGEYGDAEPTERYESQAAKNKEQDKIVLINKTRPQTCDQRIKLYQLNTDKDQAVYKTPLNGCDRQYVVMPIPKSNMILLVVDDLCPKADPTMVLSVEPMEIKYNSSLACYKVLFNEMPRRRPSFCISQHHNESSIVMCGRGNMYTYSLALLIISQIIVKLF